MDEPIYIETTIEIAAGQPAVWAKLVDIARYCDWNGYLVRVDGVLAAGESLTVHSDMGRSEPMVAPVRVISIDPPRAMRWEGSLPDRSLFRGDHWWELEALEPNRTLLRHHETFTGTLAERIVADGEAIRANFQRMNRDLKASLESQTTRGQELAR